MLLLLGGASAEELASRTEADRMLGAVICSKNT